jgi:hypothetical protein
LGHPVALWTSSNKVKERKKKNKTKEVLVDGKGTPKARPKSLKILGTKVANQNLN